MPELQTINIWDQVACDYEEYSYHEKADNYPANRFRAKILLEFFAKQPKGLVLDAGCGTGYMTRQLLKRGWKVVSVDSSRSMLKTAQAKTLEDGLTGEFHFGSILDLNFLKDQQFDYVMLNGVLPYISCQKEVAAYREFTRILKPKGWLVASHYNLFFDFFRFDRYTVEAVTNRLFEDMKLTGPAKEKLAERFSQVLSETDYPGTEKRTMKTENPIIFQDKLIKLGFTENERFYYNFYLQPPFLKTNGDKKLRFQLEEKFNNSWQGVMLAKTFISLARKSA